VRVAIAKRVVRGSGVVHAKQLALPFQAAVAGAAAAAASAGALAAGAGAAAGAAALGAGEEAAAALRAQLDVAFGRPMRLVITANRSIMLSLSRRTSPPTLRAHRIFLDAPLDVVRALASWFRRGDRRAARAIDAFIRARRPREEAAAADLAVAPARPLRLRQSGRFFHLGRLFAELNARYFDGRVSARITWGQLGKRGWRRTIKLGSYARDERLIRIHPALDRAFVPRFFIESVVHHEMVHALVEAPLVRGRRRHHGAEFRRLERTFSEHTRALAWERENLNRILKTR